MTPCSPFFKIIKLNELSGHKTNDPGLDWTSLKNGSHLYLKTNLKKAEDLENRDTFTKNTYNSALQSLHTLNELKVLKKYKDLK